MVTNEIIVPVTVTDASGDFVLDLSQKDFHIYDDSVEQSIDRWQLGGDPLAVVLVLETSSRLHAYAPVLHSLGSIFTETVMALDGEAAVVTYSSTVDLRQSFTQDHDAVEKAIASTKFEAPETNLYDAMALAVQQLESLPPTRRRIMLIVGESDDTDSTAKLGKVARDAARANISIYAVGPSSMAADIRGENEGVPPMKIWKLPPIGAQPPRRDPLGRPFYDWMTPAIWLLERGYNRYRNHQLEVIAAATGGIHYGAIRDSTLRAALDKIGGELHAQYVIGYKPSAPLAPGFHRITVTVSRTNVAIRARPGYFVASGTN
ncbi:MAG TPA: VWA domain-containing protein [Candidatus Acidoferrales bacterium]|nr:VWA domain-containing protein [Candidatus Acidoferrales bacterium]